MTTPGGGRAQAWVAAGAWLALAGLGAGALGALLGARRWWTYLGLVLALVLLAGRVEAWWLKRSQARPPKTPRGRLRLVKGGEVVDLEADRSTEKQRWLM
jgi:hypothetical protein